MGKIRKTGWEREHSILKAVREFENAKWRYKPTMTDIAYKLGLRPSTYLLNKLKSLEKRGLLAREEQPYRNKVRFVWMTTDEPLGSHWRVQL